MRRLSSTSVSYFETFSAARTMFILSLYFPCLDESGDLFLTASLILDAWPFSLPRIPFGNGLAWPKSQIEISEFRPTKIF